MQQSAALNSHEAEPAPYQVPANVHAQTVTSISHYTDRLFSFRITRPQSFRFHQK